MAVQLKRFEPAGYPGNFSRRVGVAPCGRQPRCRHPPEPRAHPRTRSSPSPPTSCRPLLWRRRCATMAPVPSAASRYWRRHAVTMALNWGWDTNTNLVIWTARHHVESHVVSQKPLFNSAERDEQPRSMPPQTRVCQESATENQKGPNEKQHNRSRRGACCGGRVVGKVVLLACLFSPPGSASTAVLYISLGGGALPTRPPPNACHPAPLGHRAHSAQCTLKLGL